MSHHQGNEITRQDLGEFESDDAAIAFGRICGDVAVGQHVEAGWNSHAHRQRHLDVGLVVTWDPMPGVFVLALAPELHRILNLRVGLKEVEPSSRRARVDDTYEQRRL